MSKVENENLNDKWFRGEDKIRPQDKQLCVVIIKELLPIVCQFRKTKHSEGVFINIGHAGLGFLTFVFWDKVRFGNLLKFRQRRTKERWLKLRNYVRRKC